MDKSGPERITCGVLCDFVHETNCDILRLLARPARSPSIRQAPILVPERSLNREAVPLPQLRERKRLGPRAE